MVKWFHFQMLLAYVCSSSPVCSIAPMAGKIATIVLKPVARQAFGMIRQIAAHVGFSVRLHSSALMVYAIVLQGTVFVVIFVRTL